MDMDGDIVDAMDSPSGVRVKVDRQGRLVLPRGFREEIVAIPGEVLLQRTASGLILTAVKEQGAVSEGDDGLPVLDLGRSVSTEETLAAIDAERADR